MIDIMKRNSMLGQQQTPYSFQPEQRKPEVEIKLKNFSKLIFVDSDDQSCQQSEPALQLRQTSYSSHKREKILNLSQHTKRPFSKEFKRDSNVLRPSLMRTPADNQEDYDQLINCQTFRPPSSNSSIINRPKNMGSTQPSTLFEKTLPSSCITDRPKIIGSAELIFEKLVEKRDIVRTQRLNRRRDRAKLCEEQSMAKEAKGSQVPTEAKRSDDVKQSQQTKKQEQEIIIPKLNIANVCFQISDQEHDEAQNNRNETEVGASTFQKLDKEQLKAVERQPAEGESFIACEQRKQLVEEVNIAEIEENAEVYKRSGYLMETIKSCYAEDNRIGDLMHIPLLPGTKHTFEVQVFSSLTDKSYLFWLERGQSRPLLMKATKLVSVSRTTFEFHTLDPVLLQYFESCTMTSSMDRSLFTLFIENRRTNQKRLLATYSQTLNIKNDKLIVAYYPKLGSNNQPTIIEEPVITKDLQTLYREHKSQVVDFAVTSKLDISNKLKLLAHFNLKASQKSMEFKNSNGSMQVIIGKIESKRYKIIAGPGLSPAQILGLTIVQIQT